MSDNDIKKRVLSMATSPTLSQVDDDFNKMSSEQDVHEFDGKCRQCRDYINTGHAVMCAEVGCGAILHPGCFGQHMVTVHVIESLPIIVRRGLSGNVSHYIIRGDVTSTERDTVSLGRETVHVTNNDIEEVVPSVEVKSRESDGKSGHAPIKKSDKPVTQREKRKKRVNDRMKERPVRSKPVTTEDSV